jgi:hypothetical protein
MEREQNLTLLGSEFKDGTPYLLKHRDSEISLTVHWLKQKNY